MKSMSDKDANEYAWNKLFGDLDGIESKSMFDDPKAPTEEKDMPKKMDGVSVEIKPIMDGEQTKDAPESMDDDKEDDKLGKLGL